MWGGAGLAGLAVTTVGGRVDANTQPSIALQQSPANSDGRFAGKVVLITGATSGIGEATARAFAQEGASVHFCGRRSDFPISLPGKRLGCWQFRSVMAMLALLGRECIPLRAYATVTCDR